MAKDLTHETQRWIWQKDGWTDFQCDPSRYQKYNSRFAFNAENLLAATVSCTKNTVSDFFKAFKIKMIGHEAFYSSEIEGENLIVESLMNSISYGFSRLAGQPKQDQSGITEMMIDSYETFDQPLTMETLHRWNSSLLKHDHNPEHVGQYRKSNEDMCVVSGGIGKEKVDYKAPPSKDVERLMENFIDWFNDTAPRGKNPLPPLVRASLAHLHFVSIHPYEDGNGRISRALSEKVLSQSLGRPTLISLSHSISNKKSAYYSALREAQQFGNTDAWVEYFSETILDAQQFTRKKLQYTILEASAQQLHPDLNKDQSEVLRRIFRVINKNGEFNGGINTEKYIKLAGAYSSCQKGKAESDLENLKERGILKHSEDEKYTLNTDSCYDSIKAGAKNVKTPITQHRMHV